VLLAKQGCKITNKLFLAVAGACAVINVARLVLRNFIDGSDYYDRYFANLSSMITGIFIFFFVFWVSSKMPKLIDVLAKNKVIAYLSEISYEIYIVHMWFLNGRWQTAKYINNVILSDLAVVGLTVVAASVLHFVSGWIIKGISKAQKT
jgi:peptidoglycan/LPS O-acetylase OafA/YrhL